MDTVHITSPIDSETLEGLTVGTRVLISGVIYTARDAAHQRLVHALDKGDRLPFDLDGHVRLFDDLSIPDTGSGYPPVDMGAYEFQGR